MINALLSLAGDAGSDGTADKGTTKYWLVKTELCKLVGGHFSFLSLRHLTGSKAGGSCFQTRLFDGIVLKFLGDEDHRVRTEAAAAVVRSVPNLHFAVDDAGAAGADTAAVAAVKGTKCHQVRSR